MTLKLHLYLKSDATFGRGDGVAGLVDQEIEHDASTGLPYLRGRTLKGLLVEECANLLFAVSQQNPAAYSKLQEAAKFLFGQAGSTLGDDAMMHVGAAMLPIELRKAVEADVKAQRLKLFEVLESLTAIRRQSAIDEKTGAPDEGSLRSMRVLLRETPLVAELRFDIQPADEALALLTACVMALRRAGIGRNRGRGRLVARLHDAEDNDITSRGFDHFRTLVKGADQ